MNIFQIGQPGGMAGLKVGELDAETAALWRLPRQVPILPEDIGAEASVAVLARGMRRLVDLQPDHPDRAAFDRFVQKADRDLWDTLADARARGDWRGAVRAGELFTAIDPEDGRAWSDLALAYRRTGKGDLAERAYRTAIRLDPALAAAQTGLGGLLFERGDMAGAVAMLDHSLKVRADQPTAWYLMGLARGEQGDDAGALDALGRALDLAPDDPRLPYPLAIALARTGDTAGAFEALDRALALNPQAPEVLALRDTLMAQLSE